MSKTLKKAISVTTSITTIAWLSGVAMLAPLAAGAITINEGDTIKTATSPDVYIAKYVGSKKFKRLILSPSVFNSYKHLSWGAIKTVSQAEMDAFTTSDLVRATGDTKVYKLVPVADSDNGSKQWLNMTAEAFTAGGYDWDSIYVINNTDRDVYTTGSDITGGTSTSPVTSGAAGALTVSLASDTPAAGIAPYNAARVAFTKFALTAGASAVTVNALVAQRSGLADDAALSSVALIDNETNLQVGLNQTLNASHQVTFRENITIPANTTKYYTLAANMPAYAVAATKAGQVAALSLVAIETSSTVSGTLPITGNGQTINATLTIGTVTGAAGSLNVSTSTKEVGTTNFNFSGIKLTAGSTEDVTVYSIRFNQSGSAASSDLSNVVVSDGTTNYATTISTDGKYYTASFGTTGITIGKGLSKEFTVKGDILSGSARTIKFDIYRSTDIVVRGTTYGYYLTLSANTTWPFNTSSNPVFTGNTITVGAGSLRVDKSATGAPAANVTKGANGVVLGAFDFVVQGEAANVASIILAFDLTSWVAGSTSDITNITLYKADGTVLAGPVDGSDTATTGPDGTATFSGTVSFPVGTTQVIVKGNLNTDFAANQTIAVSINTPATKVTSITGATTGNSITASPTSAVTCNTMTVKGGALTVSVAGTPVAQTVIKGATGYTFANYIFDASSSGEDIKVTTIALQDTEGAGADGSELTTMQLWDGTTALNTGSNVLSPSNGSTGANAYTITMDSGLIIPKGTQKTVALKGNISGSATAGSTNTHAWGLIASAAVTATGVSTGLDISESVNAATGSAMTIASSGQYSVELDSSSPVARLVAANTTGNTMTVLRFLATSETINVDKLKLALSSASSSCNDISKIYVYDGSTLLASGVIGIGDAAGAGADARTTYTLSPTLTLPANEEKLVTIKADIAPILTSSTIADAGHSIAIDYYLGSVSATTNGGVGASSGTSIAAYSATTSQASAIIYRSIPTVSKIDVSTTKLTNGTMDLLKFRVAADAKGDIDLYKFTFNVATSVATVTYPTLVDVTGGVETTLYATGTPGFLTSWASGTTDFDVILVASPGTPNVPAGGTAIPRTVAAGSYRDFVLRATISGATTNATVVTQLQGDAAMQQANATYMTTAALVDGWTDDDFIWSDKSSASHAIGTSDWTNGYLVSGLPSSNLTPQTLAY
jgi:hypothetical protein